MFRTGGAVAASIGLRLGSALADELLLELR
jgi:hypothetical protein